MVKDNKNTDVNSANGGVYDKIESLKNYFKPSDCRVTQLKKRVVSSLILIPFAIYAILFSKSLFIFFAVAMAILMTFEWCDMSIERRGKAKWRLIGFLYIIFPIFCLIKIRLIDSDVLFWMFLVIWSTDISAYFTGKVIGGPKLAPSISPGKTWSGFFGGVAAAIVIGFFTAFMFVGDMVFFIILSTILSIACQAGDLMESKFKRIFNVKDSSNIIPGHGGILDRMDGVMLAAPVLLLAITISGGQFGL